MLGLASDSSPCLAEGLCVSGKQKITTQSHFPNEMKFPNCRVQRAVGLHRHDTVSQKTCMEFEKKPSLIVKKRILVEFRLHLWVTYLFLRISLKGTLSLGDLIYHRFSCRKPFVSVLYSNLEKNYVILFLAVY